MRYVVDKLNGRMGEWVMGQFGKKAVAPYRALGMIDDEGTLRGGVVLNGFNGSNVDITAYLLEPISREGLTFMFAYIFEQLGCQRITARTRRGNPKVKANPLAHFHGNGRGAILLRMGFRFECVAKRWYGAGEENDALVFSMLRDDWLRSRYGRPRAARSDGNRAGPAADESRNRDHAGRPQYDKSVNTMGQPHL